MKSSVRFPCLALAAATAVVWSSAAWIGPAQAQGIFDFLFRPMFRERPAPPPEQRSAYAPEISGDRDLGPGDGDPRVRGPYSSPRISGGTGTYTSYCVRLCDGKYFPVQPAHAGELCSSFCPASETKVFAGSDMQTARAKDGERYGDLENAFVYRDHFVDGCTCNGKDPVGLAKIDINDDPTVKRGDMVATSDGPQKLARPERSASAEDRPPPRRRYSHRRHEGFFPFSFFR